MNTAVKERHEPLKLDQAAIDEASKSLDEGAVTPSYGPWRDDIVKLLNDALATELVCVLRYKRHYFTASGEASPAIADEFLVHANEESAHADNIAERIVQLGGEPDFNPQSLQGRSHASYDESLEPAGDGARQPGGRAHRGRDLPPDDRADRRQGPDDPAHAGRHPDRRGRARRRTEGLARPLIPLVRQKKPGNRAFVRPRCRRRHIFDFELVVDRVTPLTDFAISPARALAAAVGAGPAQRHLRRPWCRRRS